MKIYKTSFRNPMDLAASKIAQKTLLFLKNQIIKANKTNGIAQTTVKYDGFLVPILVRIEISQENIAVPFAVRANYSSTQDFYQYALNPSTYISKDRKTTILIQLSRMFSNKNYNELYLSLTNIIRHELQHMKDDDNHIPMKKGMNPGYNINSIINKKFEETFNERSSYILSYAEQEPFIRGLMLRAKKEHVSFVDLLNKLINNMLFKNDEKLKQYFTKKYGELDVNHRIQLIRDTYLKRAKAIFPNIKD